MARVSQSAQRSFAPLPEHRRSAIRQKLNGKLFLKGGPKISDICQGAVGDCFVLAGLAALAHTRPRVIKKHITADCHGDVHVRMARGIQIVPPREMFVDRKTHEPLYAYPVGGATWVVLMENAMAMQAGGFAVLDKGGRPGDAVETLTGFKSVRRKVSSDADFARMVDALLKEIPCTAETWPEASRVDGTCFRLDHAYTVLGAGQSIALDPSSGYVDVLDPFGSCDDRPQTHPGSAFGLSEHGHHRVPWNDFKKYFLAYTTNRPV